MQIKWSRTYILLLIMICVLLIGVFLYIKANWLDMKRESLQVTEHTLSEQQELIDFASNTDRSKQSWLSDSDNLRKKIPTAANVDQLVTLIKGIEKTSNITVKQMNRLSNQEVPEQDFYPADITLLEYQLDVEASSLHVFEQFVNNLSNSERVIELTHIYYTAEEEILTGSVIIRSFFNENILINN
ncbi:hypothetical protein [Gracilibacillus kekensis]|uniref:Tfp pilus assembly protein PilO n=1 Tax=Gracilibacillus kekensis TaxID=1027249 RepID=A0A1M7NY38_9BACI|nr:hypothetical protein [Gracilibacillus kekensis]SHN08565.1 hypothetical protein SAMN05216179_1812 [Gracilibacillus kekensis]